MFPLLVFTCLMSGWVALGAGPEDGMGCQTFFFTGGYFTFCEGKNSNYESLVGQMEKGGPGGGMAAKSNESTLDTRSMTAQTAQSCNQGSCNTASMPSFPTLLYNRNKEPRYIVQLETFKQPQHFYICSGRGCGSDSVCEQSFTEVQLLCVDPQDHSQMDVKWDTFRLPSCCNCVDKGSSPGPEQR